MKKILKWFGKIPILLWALVLFGGNIIAAMVGDMAVILTFNIIWTAVAGMGVLSQIFSKK